MALKVAINGFGRIGRLVFRAGIKNPNLEFVGINDLFPPENLAYLLKHDSTHGKYKGTVEAQERWHHRRWQIRPTCAIKNPAELPWGKLAADYIVESTGLFTDYAGAENHLKAGGKRVIISAPTKDPEKVPTYLMGVNANKFDPAKDKIVSQRLLHHQLPRARSQSHQRHLRPGRRPHDTVHAATATQPTVDGPSKKTGRGGRGAYQNIIPSATGAAKPSPWCCPN